MPHQACDPLRLKPQLAKLSDLDALETLENKIFQGDRLSRRSLRYYISTRTAILRVVKQHGTLAGYSLVAFRTSSSLARLYSIAVDEAFAGQGVGRLLLTTCERDAQKNSCRALRLEVRIDNTRAIALYERSGYTRFDEIEDYYEDGATALRFEKTL